MTLNYSGAHPINLAVDCLIFGVRQGKLCLLIFKREVEPLAGEWSLIGSFVKRDEDVDQAAKRVLKELTGLENSYMEQLRCYGDSQRDHGGRVVSIAYWSLIKLEQNHIKINIRNHEAKWVELEKCPHLVLDHNEMVEDAILRLRERTRFHPVGFELLPKEFTIPQLLQVYEAIFSRSIDDRNFRKKILKSDLLIKLDKKDKSTSKKGSYLYSFDKLRYKQLQTSGYNFDLIF